MDEEKNRSEYFNDLNPLPVEKSKKKRDFSGYSVKAVIIVLLVLLLSLALFKFIFK